MHRPLHAIMPQYLCAFFLGHLEQKPSWDISSEVQCNFSHSICKSRDHKTLCINLMSIICSPLPNEIPTNDSKEIIIPPSFNLNKRMHQAPKYGPWYILCTYMHICPSGIYHTFHQFHQMRLQNIFDIKALKVHYHMLALGMLHIFPLQQHNFTK